MKGTGIVVAGPGASLWPARWIRVSMRIGSPKPQQKGRLTMQEDPEALLGSAIEYRRLSAVTGIYGQGR